jgi:hypothetical protein
VPQSGTFVVLQGGGELLWPNDETRTIGKNEGVLSRRGAFYSF